jgi:hypothetical protein
VPAGAAQCRARSPTIYAFDSVLELRFTELSESKSVLVIISVRSYYSCE